MPPHALPRPSRVLRRALGGLAVAALVTGTGAPAASAGAVAAASAPSAEQLDTQRQEAQRLDAEAQAAQQAVADAQARLGELSAQAGEALERHQSALAEADAAEAERALQEERLAVATDVLAGNRTDLGRWASQAYRDGGAMADYESLMTLLDAEDSDDLSQRLAMLRVVGRARGTAVETAQEAKLVQQDATARSQAAALRAQDAVARAAEAKTQADALLEQQRVQLASLDELLARTQQDAAAASARAEQMGLALAAAEQRRQTLAAASAGSGRRGSNAVTGPVGDCAGGDVSGFPNGGIPASALCPVGGGGHLLRADAAHAFGQLAAAYSAQFGSGLCITDSYRTLASQVRLYATKPNLAAVPGTSNHGWGTAVDLCGGIQNFGSAQHRWMRDNAPLYGWFLPSWAQQGGSRPEPWHWEYGG